MDLIDEQEQLKRDLDQLRQLIVFDDELSLSGIQSATTAVVEDDIFVPPPDEDSSSTSIPFSISKSEVFSCSTSSANPSSSKRRSLRHCLDLNIDYQATLQNYLAVVRQAKLKIQQEIALKEQEIQVEQEERKFRSNRRPTPIIHRLGPITLACFRRPYFKTVFGLEPLSNDDVKAKSYYGELLPSDEQYQSGWKWYDEAMKNRLFREVRRECLAKLLEPYSIHRQELRTLAGEIDGPSLHEVYLDLEETEKSMKIIARDVKTEDLLNNQDLMGRIDWMKVAKRLGGSVTHVTCQLVWSNYYSPTINKRPFKRKEDERLGEIVKEHDRRNWVETAISLNTGRCAFQCLQRYQSKLFRSHEPAVEDESEEVELAIWRQQDEQRLMWVVESLGLKSPDSLRYIDWQYVAQNVGEFSRGECCERYIQLSSKLNIGGWSKEEHSKLEEAIRTYGCCNWIPVSTFVETRSPKQCQRHWQDTLSKKHTERMIEKCPPPDWTAEEDAVLWFCRNSTSAFLRTYSGIVRLLPGRFKQEIADRFKLLKTWQKQAEWLLKNDGTLLSLVLKSDSELTMAEVQKMRLELARLRTKRRLKRPNLSEEDSEQLNVVSFDEQSQLERLTNAMILEASLSRDLVRDKMKLIHEIVELKAVPVPLLRNLPDRASHLDGRAEVFRKIRELLLQVTADRRKKRTKQAPDEPSTSMVVDESPNFDHILARIRNASNNPKTTDLAREVMLNLESVRGGTQVKDLIRLVRQLHALSCRRKPPNDSYLGKAATASEWAEFRDQIGGLYPNIRRRKHNKRNPHLYEDLPMGPKRKRYKVPSGQTIKQTTKLLVSALGTNLEGVTAEVERQMQVDETQDQNHEIANNLKIHLPSTEESSAARIRRFHAKCALQAMTAPVADPSTGRGSFSSVHEEFNESVRVTAEDFGEGNSAPVFPPNIATCNTFRLLSLSKLRLNNVLGECPPEQKEKLMQKLQQLKERPSEGYGLLKRRFESLFTWPALLTEVFPQVEDKGEPCNPTDLKSGGTFPMFRKKFDQRYQRRIRRTPFSLPSSHGKVRNATPSPANSQQTPPIVVVESEQSVEVTEPVADQSNTQPIKKAHKKRLTGRSVALELAERAVLRHQLSNPRAPIAHQQNQPLVPPQVEFQIEVEVILPTNEAVASNEIVLKELEPENSTSNELIPKKPLEPLAADVQNIVIVVENPPLPPPESPLQAEENIQEVQHGKGEIRPNEVEPVVVVDIGSPVEVGELRQPRKSTLRKRKNPLAPSHQQQVVAQPPSMPFDSDDEPLSKLAANELPGIPMGTRRKGNRRCKTAKKPKSMTTEQNRVTRSQSNKKSRQEEARTWNLRSRPVKSEPKIKRAEPCGQEPTGPSAKVLRSGTVVLP